MFAMKKQLMIAIFGLVAMLTFTVQFDDVPVDVGKQVKEMFVDYEQHEGTIVFDVGKSGNEYEALYLLNSHLPSAPNLRQIPTGYARSKPGWQSVQAKVVNTQYFKGLHQIKI